MIEFVNEVGVEPINVSASDDMVAMAAWVSNDADSAARLKDRKAVEGLINFLYRNRHMSPFEHGIFTIKVDVPLFVAREFHRHRTASYNEVSGRYTEMKPRFYEGDIVRVQKGKMGNYFFEDGTNEQTAVYKANKKSLADTWANYQQNLEYGISKEQSREDLPLSMMTQFYVTMNPRNLMQFLTLRNDKHALKEIRDVAVKMEDIFKEAMPLTWAAFNKARVEAEIDYKAEYQAQMRISEDLQYALSLLREEVAELKADRILLEEERGKLEDDYESLLTKYNKEFVAAHEPEPADDTVDFGSSIINDDEWLNKMRQFEKMVTPVYNIYVQQKDTDPREIARLLKDKINGTLRDN